MQTKGHVEVAVAIIGVPSEAAALCPRAVFNASPNKTIVRKFAVEFPLRNAAAISGVGFAGLPAAAATEPAEAALLRTRVAEKQRRKQNENCQARDHFSSRRRWVLWPS